MTTPQAADSVAPCPTCGEPDGERYGPENVCWPCHCQTSNGTTPAAVSDAVEHDMAAEVEAAVVSLEEFIAVDEPGAAALLGTQESALIPEGGDVMLYGEGGAGKTTLSFDLACHLASGSTWLGIPVPRPVRVLLIENEGPRPQLRKKLKRKVAAWNGPALDGRISVLSSPWGQFTFATETWRSKVASIINERSIDVLVVGPVTRAGMDAAGTLQEVNAFMRFVEELRTACGRRLVVVLIHHENKTGAVSGAWEGAGDTLLHVQGAGNGHTVMFVQKARWASELHGTTLKLRWTGGEGFALESDRDLLAEIEHLLTDGVWRTAKEIAAPKDRGGIGSNADTVRTLLDEHPDRFALRTGHAAKEIGRSPSANVWQVTQTPESPESPAGFLGGGDGGDSGDSPLKGVTGSEAPPLSLAGADLDGQVGSNQDGRVEQAAGGGGES